MSAIPSNGRPRRAAGVLALALCSGLMAGCSDGPSKAGPAPAGAETPGAARSTPVALPADRPQVAACGLVTVAEVEAAIGAKVTAGKQDAQTARSVCAFTLASGPDQTVVIVATSSSGVPAAFDAARARADSPQSVAAGEQAFVTGPQALVRKGTTMVAIQVVTRQLPALLTAAATKLAQAVGAHL